MKKQVIVLTVGYPASGKSTLIKQLREKFQELNVVNGDSLRDLLRKEMKYFNNLEFSELTPEVKRANAIVKEYKKLIIGELTLSGQSILVEGNHLEKSARNKWLSIAKEINKNILTIILYFKISESEVIKRYQDRGKNDPESKWVAEFEKWRKDQLEEPSADEADKIIIFNQNNQEDTIKELSLILK